MPKLKKGAPAEETTVITEEVVTAAPAAEKKTAAKKPSVKKPAAKKVVEKKTAVKKTVAEKKTPTKKTSLKAAVAVFVQSAGKQASPDELVARAKADWTDKGNDLASMKKIAVYFNADEGMVYYAVNEDENSGSYAF